MNKLKIIVIFSVLLSLLGLNAYAEMHVVNRGRGPIPFHGGERVIHGHGGYYDRGGYSYGGGWGGPNIIINVPAERYYPPVCDNVEVCNSYGECWLERYCN